MRSQQLHSALAEYIEAAAAELQELIDAGAEVPFELGSRGTRRGSTPLYCYRALTSAFIAEHERLLEHVPGYDEATRLLEAYDGLDRYLAAGGVQVPHLRGRVRARTGLMALLGEVFEEQTDFQVRPERMQAALARLERSGCAEPGEMTLVATLHGMTIASDELLLTRGLQIARPLALRGLPDDAIAGPGGPHGSEHLVVVLAFRERDGAPAPGGEGDLLEHGRAVLADLLRALRLFGDGRVALGPLAWARVGEGPWSAGPLGRAGAPRGMLVLTLDQEDELRAFCNLVSARAPHGNAPAWALRRFELGCERDDPFEALSDHLLALRALLEPEGPASGMLAGRLAALCAPPEQRPALSERVLAAIELERTLMSGARTRRARAQALCGELADHLRALLRDVICGHLTADLPSLADELLAAPEPHAAEEAPPPAEQTAEPVPA